MSTVYTFGPVLYDKMILAPEFKTLSKQETVFEPVRLFGEFGIRFECDPTLPKDTFEIRGIIDGKPYCKRYKLTEGK